MAEERKLRGFSELAEKYGKAAAAAYADAYDRLIGMRVTNLSWRDDNTKGVHIGLKYPSLSSINLSDESYSCHICARNRSWDTRHYSQHELGAGQLQRLAEVLAAAADEETAYRERSAWKGEVDLEGIAAGAAAMFPKLDISVSVGKRNIDEGVEPYKAIVVRRNGCQKGSITINVDWRGIAVLNCRVPLCGESRHDVTKDGIMDDVAYWVRFMTN